MAKSILPTRAFLTDYLQADILFCISAMKDELKRLPLCCCDGCEKSDHILLVNKEQQAFPCCIGSPRSWQGATAAPIIQPAAALPPITDTKAKRRQKASGGRV
jgi:hypothetical protein